MKLQILKEAHAEIVNGIVALGNKILESSQDGKRLTKASINKVGKIIADYESVAEIFDIQDIKNKVNELKEEVNKADADTLKSSEDERIKFIDNIVNIGVEIDKISSSTYGTRVVDLD